MPRSNVTWQVWGKTISAAPGAHCLPVHTGCQVRIFAQKISHGKKALSAKKCAFFTPLRIILCEPKMHIHSMSVLWITPVEKSVENVENYELSTGILLF